MVIFLSHNGKDKDKVEPIALVLKDIYGQDNVFYDSWSIQPTDGIIGKMSQGLDECKFFFLFLSKNSLSSTFVGLEWESALFKRLRLNTSFATVLLEKCDIPTILQHLKYIDYYHEGPEVTIKQIKDVIDGRNTFVPKENFHNTMASFNVENNILIGKVEAIHYMEPHADILLEIENSVDDIEVTTKGFSLPEEKHNDFEVSPGYKANIIKISRLAPITKGYPLRFDLKSIHNNFIHIKGVYIRIGEEQYKQIPSKVYS